MDRRIGVRGRCQNVNKSKAGPRSRDCGHVARHIQNDVAGEIQGPDARWILARAEGDDTGGVGVRRAGDRDGTPLSVIEIANVLVAVLKNRRPVKPRPANE